MKLTIALLSLCTVAALAEENIPSGYTLLYEQTFENAEAVDDFVMTDPNAWKFSPAPGGGGALELAQQSKYKPEVRSPLNMALIKDHLFGDFIVEVNMVQTGREYGHRDMCIFFGFQSPKEFYYAHMATKADPNAHNVFIVNNAPRKNIALTTTEGVNWGLEVWHKVRLERKMADGRIKVYFNDMTLPIMVAEDKTFGPGLLGFGSFDDTGKIDNIRVWGPSASKRSEPVIFKSAD